MDPARRRSPVCTAVSSRADYPEIGKEGTAMRFLVYIVPIVLLVYCWVEIAQSDPRQVRQLPRGVWAVMVLIPIAGPVAWLIYGRPNGEDVVEATSRPRPRPRVVAPDDDPEFLRSLRRPPEDDESSR
jgi:hypothetical protein